MLGMEQDGGCLSLRSSKADGELDAWSSLASLKEMGLKPKIEEEIPRHGQGSPAGKVEPLPVLWPENFDPLVFTVNTDRSAGLRTATGCGRSPSWTSGHSLRKGEGIDKP